MRCTGFKRKCCPSSPWGGAGRPLVEAGGRGGGLLIVNSSMVERTAERSDVRVVMVDAVREATALGDARVANMVLLGAFLATTPVVSPETVRQALRELIPPSRAQMVDLNLSAITRGAEIAREQVLLERV